MTIYEDDIAFLGEWGPFQKTIFFLISISIIPNGYVAVAAVFLSDTPPHHCREPLANTNGVSYFLSPKEMDSEQVLGSCTRYKEMNESSPRFQNETEGCLDGWDFSTEQYASTIVTEWNLVCNEAWKAPFAGSVFFFGVFTGSLMSGQISDRFGRKIVFFGGMALQTISSLLQASSNSWEIYCIFNLFAGIGAISKYNAAFVLGSELLCKSSRVMFSSLGVCVCFALGYMVLPLFAFFIRGWRMLLVALASIGFLFTPLWWFIPESPRWLMTRGRVTEAEAIIQAAARRNGVSAPEVIFRMEDSAYLNKTDSKKEHQQLYTILDLFKTANIRNITIIILFTWMVSLVTYYGINLGTSKMGGDPYLNCFISGAFEMASYITAWLILRYCRRRFTLFGMMLFSGSMLLIVQLLPQDVSTLILLMVMLGKTAITAASCFIYVYCIELFPTVVRSMGLGLVSTSGCIGSITAPYIPYLGDYNKYLPYILMGCLSVFAGLLTVLLPETKDVELPEQISQTPKLRLCGGVGCRSDLERK